MSDPLEELKRENELLRAELADLRSTLYRAEQRIPELKKQITDMVEETHAAFQIGIPLGNVTSRYKKTAEAHGRSLYDLIDELQVEGQLYKLRATSGDCYLVPGHYKELFEGVNLAFAPPHIIKNIKYLTRKRAEIWKEVENGTEIKTKQGLGTSDQNLERSIADALTEITKQGKLRLTPSSSLGTSGSAGPTPATSDLLHPSDHTHCTD